MASYVYDAWVIENEEEQVLCIGGPILFATEEKANEAIKDRGEVGKSKAEQVIVYVVRVNPLKEEASNEKR